MSESVATIRWTSRPQVPRRRGYYEAPRRAPTDVPLPAWYIAHLNESRDRLIKGLIRIQRSAARTVHTRSRVDTGLMKRSVTGEARTHTDVLSITFGWPGNNPFYAPFQEFGTRNGIQPMMAVHSAFHAAVPQVQRLIKR